MFGVGLISSRTNSFDRCPDSSRMNRSAWGGPKPNVRPLSASILFCLCLPKEIEKRSPKNNPNAPTQTDGVFFSAFCPFGSAARSASAMFEIWVGSAPNASTHICRRGWLAALFQQIAQILHYFTSKHIVHNQINIIVLQAE